MPDSSFYSSLGVKYEEAFAHDSGLISFTEGTLTHVPPQALILDVGCGTGKPVATTLAAAGHRIIGIDIADKMIELSRAAVPEGSFEVADMRSYTPPEKELDAVFNILSLFLLNREEMEEMTLKWASWLRKGGILCICTMAAEDLESEAKSSKYDADGACARDIEVLFMGSRVKITLFTRDGWAMVLKKAGFEILNTKTELFTPPKEANSDPEPHLYLTAKKI